ncbi:YchJ family metal-binding protein [Rhodococcus sp. G-MC3]|uniref:YchJ family protein n=1 Tax=Rhodococcus sp. G-MC3 TaxID=3046209 RepID=UPI0024BA8CF3|nr:YchJ family metal-binding protein [Rhodococcus sp. G-MC3]MDJ0393134.1 YchJ family metal-binding protein [Rhodococcus sp. G-MC3]
MIKACPCLRGEQFENCCKPFLRGDALPPTAEHLMRSRFSAFSVGDADYLLRTWYPSTAPGTVELDPTQRWYRLDIHAAQLGGLMDTTGKVEFSAFYTHPDGNGVLREASRFVKEDRRWLYVDGVTAG